MAIFQQIPATVDAEQFLRDDQPWPAEVKAWSESAQPLYGSDAWIQTAHGALLINDTDWVLRWPNGALTFFNGRMVFMPPGSVTVCNAQAFQRLFAQQELANHA